MPNQSLLPVERGYPERLPVPNELTQWDEPHSVYIDAPVYARGDNLIELLADVGVEVANPTELRILGMLPTRQAVEVFGPAIERIRNPLGRTGINGTGIFYQAGEAPAADMAITRWHPEHGRQIALVYSRRWGLPGGFCESGEKDDRRQAAVREAYEETGLDITHIPLALPVQTLFPVHVKPNSKRSVDYGFITTQVEYAALSDYRDGDNMLANDDAEAADWFTLHEVKELLEQGQMSPDHLGYAMRALTYMPR